VEKVFATGGTSNAALAKGGPGRRGHTTTEDFTVAPIVVLRPELGTTARAAAPAATSSSSATTAPAAGMPASSFVPAAARTAIPVFLRSCAAPAKNEQDCTHRAESHRSKNLAPRPRLTDYLHGCIFPSRDRIHFRPSTT